MQNFTIKFQVTDADLAAINHAVQADPEQKPGETPGDAWVRRVMNDPSAPLWERMRRVCAKADKYREAHAAEVAAMGEDYLPAAAKAALAEVAASDETAAAKLADYGARLDAAKAEPSGDAGDVAGVK